MIKQCPPGCTRSGVIHERLEVAPSYRSFALLSLYNNGLPLHGKPHSTQTLEHVQQRFRILVTFQSSGEYNILHPRILVKYLDIIPLGYQRHDILQTLGFKQIHPVFPRHEQLDVHFPHIVPPARLIIHQLFRRAQHGNLSR